MKSDKTFGIPFFLQNDDFCSYLEKKHFMRDEAQLFYKEKKQSVFRSNYRAGCFLDILKYVDVIRLTFMYLITQELSEYA